MDPKIWGSKLWNIIFDICWMLEKRGNRLPKKTKDSCMIFFESMKYLLPCIYCRDSYKKYMKKLKECPSCEGALKWSYNLKNLVNRKLKNKSISYECFERRMKTWSTASSVNDVWDILSVYAMNFSNNSTDITRKEKRMWLTLLLTVLPDILLHLPDKKIQGKILQKNPPTEKDMQCRTSILKYLCSRANEISSENRSPKDLLRKFSNCKAKKMNK